MHGNSIRLRLSQSEVTNLAEKGLVEEKTDFPNGQNFTYALSAMTETDNLLAEFLNGKIEIKIPKEIAENWANSNEVGIYGTHENIQIAVEKDFKCLTIREGEDESDSFPHPREKEINC